MKKSRKLINLLGCMALVLFLPACGGNPGTADLSQGDASAPAEAAVLPAKEPLALFPMAESFLIRPMTKR